MKATLLGATFLIDFMYFEKQSGGSWDIFMHFFMCHELEYSFFVLIINVSQDTKNIPIRHKIITYQADIDVGH